MTGLLLDNIGSLVTSDPGIGDGPPGWSAAAGRGCVCRGLALSSPGDPGQ